MKTTGLTGSVGLFASAVQNTLARQNVGPWGVFVRSGGTIGIFGMIRLMIMECLSELISNALFNQPPWEVPMSS